MSDFSFNDSIADETEEEQTGYNSDPGEKKKIIKFLIIVVVAAIAGLSVYFITDALINGNRKPTTTTTAVDSEMELSDEMVVYLYDNVSYAVNGVRSDKFFKSASINPSDFTNQEKFYFALRYAVESDFIDMTTSTATESDEKEKDDDGSAKEEKKELKTYSISNDKIREYMFNFFGDDVSYSTSGSIPIAVNFLKDGYNAGTLNYDSMSDSFLVKFDSVSAGGSSMVVNPYLYKLVSAMREGKTSNIIIEEIVVFTQTNQYTDETGKPIDKYDYAVYKDFAKTSALEQKAGVTKSELSLIGIENYKDYATKIKYTFFKDENDEYHFLKSEIVSE